MLTRKQRCQINRKNAARSTGPITPDGKNQSRRNALKHGLRAETLLLPTENLDAIQDRFDDWTDHYGPDSPGERFLIDRAVYLGILLERCAVYQTALVAQQIRHALLDFEFRAQTAIEPLKVLLQGDDPSAAADHLRQTAAGCRWLIRGFEAMARIIRDGQFWDAGDRDLVIRLTGIHPTRPGIEMSGLGLALDAHRSLYQPSVFETEENTAEWSAFRAQLLALLEEDIAELRPQEARLHAIEEQDRAEVVTRSLLPDGPQGALSLRYERMYALSFQRVYQEILRAIAVAEKAEKAGELDEEDRAERSGESDAPNEANGRAKGPLSSRAARASERDCGRNLTVVPGGSESELMAGGEADGPARESEGAAGAFPG